MRDEFFIDRCDDAEFHLAIVRYLEGDICPRELAELNDKLRFDPGCREVFVQVCLTRAGLIEEISSKAEHIRQLESPFELDMDEQTRDLSETLIAPALRLLPDEVEEEPEFTPAPFVFKRPARGKLTSWRLAAAMLVVLTAGIILTVGGILRFDHRANPTADAQANPSPSAVVVSPATAPVLAQRDLNAVQPLLPKAAVVEKDLGTVAYALDADWGAPDAPLLTSSKLSPGPHTLVRGVVDIKFANGTDVVIQGPAQFQADSDSHIHLSQGKLCAKVPHTGAALTVATPDMSAVDLGTEFGLDVRPDVQTHLEVFQGRVRSEVSGPAGVVATRLLSRNQAVVAASGSGTIEQATPKPLAFVRSAEMDALAKASDTPFKRWLGFSLLLRQDADLVAYYPFDNQAENADELINRAAATSSQYDATFGNGTVRTHLPKWSTGRWPGKAALSFGDDGSSAVTFSNAAGMIPRQSITVGIWLKRTETTRAVHLINGMVGAHTGFNLEVVGTLGKPSMKLAASTAYFVWQPTEVHSLPALPRDDRWYFLTITSDVHEGTRFYVDGTLIGTTPSNGRAVPALDVLTMGAAVNGNPGAAARDIFHGSIDELLIFRRVLSADEIQRVYLAGGEY